MVFKWKFAHNDMWYFAGKWYSNESLPINEVILCWQMLFQWKFAHNDMWYFAGNWYSNESLPIMMWYFAGKWYSNESLPIMMWHFAGKWYSNESLPIIMWYFAGKWYSNESLPLVICNTLLANRIQMKVCPYCYNVVIMFNLGKYSVVVKGMFYCLRQLSLLCKQLDSFS